MKNKLYIIFLFCISFSLKSISGNYADSLKNLLSNTNDPSVKYDIYYKLVRHLANSRTTDSKKYYLLANELSKKINSPAITAKTALLEAIVANDEEDGNSSNLLLKNVILQLSSNNLKKETAEAYSFLGIKLLSSGDYIQAIENFEQSTRIATELNENLQLAENYTYTGRCFDGMGNVPKALEYYQRALIIAESAKKSRLVTQINMFIGALYSEGVNHSLAMDYLMKAVSAGEAVKDTALLINAYTYMANIYYYQKKYDLALLKYEKIISFCSSFGNKRIYAGTLGNMGNVYADMGKMEKAMELQLQAVKIYNAVGDKQGLTICYSAIGADQLSLKQYDKALESFSIALPMAQEMNSIEDLIEIHFNLSRLYEENKDYEKAFLNYKLFKKYSDSVYNNANAQKITEMELNYKYENEQKEAALKQEIIKVRFSRIVYTITFGALILVIIVVLVIRANRQRKKTNEQLTITNNAIRSQKEELETHKKEITDSINYAKRIQESILPPENYWKNCLPDSFIFYRPKDIVSGDFYWIEQKNDSVCFAAVDCTGHGVPGALMSVVGFNLLTQAVNEMNLTIPSDILKHLDYGVTKTLRQTEDGKGVKDGMDLSLCSLNLKTNELQYAGAYNSLYYVTDGQFHEIKSDKFPIGVNIDGKVDNYTNHSVQLKKGDCVFLFSDGYADQFGGERGKKFKYNQLKELLHKNYLLPIEEQKQQLTNVFDAWKGDLEQVDDVLIIGVRV